ncbi:MAG: DUF2853 family protein, partial [Minisyncoccia bacterium]
KEQQIIKYTEQLKKAKVPVNKELLEKVVKMVGPANYQLDAMFVATSDKTELQTVLKKFVMKKLDVADEAKGQKAIDAATLKLKNAGIRKKYRGVFYYMLAKKFGIK